MGAMQLGFSFMRAVKSLMLQLLLVLSSFSPVMAKSMMPPTLVQQLPFESYRMPIWSLPKSAGCQRCGPTNEQEPDVGENVVNHPKGNWQIREKTRVRELLQLTFRVKRTKLSGPPAQAEHGELFSAQLSFPGSLGDPNNLWKYLIIDTSKGYWKKLDVKF